MSLTQLSPSWRTRLSRLVLLITIGATVATSSSDWTREGFDSVPLPSTFPAGGLRVEAAVHYRAPRGVWPIRVTARFTPVLRGVNLRQEVVFDEEAVRADAEAPGLFELRCPEKECEGILSVDLLITAAQANQEPFANPVMGVSSSLELRAGVSGEPEGDFLGCQRQQSSTDRSSPPSKLLFDVIIDPIDSSLYGDAGVSDAGARGSSALPPVRGLDAGLE